MQTVINSPISCETFEYFWDEKKHPVAFAMKIKELMGAGLSEEEAREAITGYSVTMEVVYSPDRGLFCVESDAIECTDIYDPYTGEECVVLEDY